jgi:hypothetical protein
MNLSEATLRQCIKGEPVGDRYPYNNGSKQEIENFLKQVIAELKDSQLIQIDADFSHYGSGYASYVDLFCYYKDGSFNIQRGETTWIIGITLYLSRLAPVAVYGSGEKTKRKDGGSYSFLRPEDVGTLPEGEWNEVLYEISNKLIKFGFDLLQPEDILPLLIFDTKIFTILNNGAYRVFDALFYWED